jgi:hypothetical protein
MKTKAIWLTQGYVALVDEEDFEVLSRYSWCIKRSCSGALPYAARWRKAEDGPGSAKVLMHRQILGLHNEPTRELSNWHEIDHINRNSLDNRKVNLRYVDRRTQRRNRAR